MKAHAIIGAGWGDEGKGLAVDALSARLEAQGRQVTVVRSNGGAQAGHGVTMPDGRHHVFHHVGAGTFTGADTHLSRFFVSHPMVFFDEIEALKGKGVSSPAITVDPRSPATTPWDMAINQALEMARAGGRHGSCGLGFGETLERQDVGPSLTVGDLESRGLRGLLQEIRDAWVPRRMNALGLELPDGPLGGVLGGSDGVLDRFSDDLERYLTLVSIASDADLHHRDAVIFEAAQGLRLDMDLGDFPHVTRSHTGLPNMIGIARLSGIEKIDVTYMTRAYATRHGAGPFPHDAGTSPLEGTAVIDRTNVVNDWQQAIRYAPLDLRSMERVIDADIARVSGAGIDIGASLGVTCIDQVEEEIPLCVFDDLIGGDGHPVMSMVPREDVADVISGQIGRPLGMTSRGPTRKDVSFDAVPGSPYSPHP